MLLQLKDFCIDDGIRQDMCVIHQRRVKHLFRSQSDCDPGQIGIPSIMLSHWWHIDLSVQTPIG